MTGKSNRGKAYRELPGGGRRLRNFCEYIPELRAEHSSRRRRGDGRYTVGSMTVLHEADGREASVNLGGNTEERQLSS